MKVDVQLNVHYPKIDRNDTYYYPLDDSELTMWLNEATHMQNAHVNDNHKTSFYAYKKTERTELLLRICVALFGIKDDNNNNVLSLGVYSIDEHRAAEVVKKKIVKCAHADGTVEVNVVYLSTLDMEKNKFAAEIPVFVVRKNDDTVVYVDQNGNSYLAPHAAIEAIGMSFRGVIIYPHRLSYQPVKGQKKVDLLYTESSGCSLVNRTQAVVETALTSIGIVLGAATLVCALPLPAFLNATAAVVRAGSFYVGLSSTIVMALKTGTDLATSFKNKDHEVMTSKGLLVLTMLLSSATQVANSKMSKYAREMKSLTEVTNKCGGHFKLILYSLRGATLFSSSLSILSSIYALYKQRKRSFRDYYALSMSLFSYFNVVISTKTIQSTLDSEPLRKAEKMMHSLSEDAADQLRDLLAANMSTDDRVHMLRNLVRIDDIDDFLVQTKVQGTKLSFNSEAITFDGSITMTPENWNMIGKDVQLAMLQEALTGTLDPKKFANIAKAYGVPLNPKNASEENPQARVKRCEKEEKSLMARESEMDRTEYAQQLAAKQKQLNLAKLYAATDAVSKMPQELLDKMKSAMLVCAKYRRQDFLRASRMYGDVEKYNKTVDDWEKSFTKGTTLAQLRTRVESKDATNEPLKKAEAARRLRNFFDDRANNKDGISPKSYNKTHGAGAYDADRKLVGNEGKLREIEKQSADHRLFAEAVKSFNNGQNERLHYTFNTREVDKLILQRFEGKDLNSVEVAGKQIFKNMNVNQYSRIYRVFRENPDFIDKALELCNDPQIAPFINTSGDVASAIEIVKLKLTNDQIKLTMETIKELEAVKTSDLSWSSKLSMTYHYHKHKGEFGDSGLTMKDYFKTYAEDLFQSKHKFNGSLYDQRGGLREIYMRTFEGRTHVGFSYPTPKLHGRGQIINVNSHFIKE